MGWAIERQVALSQIPTAYEPPAQEPRVTVVLTTLHAATLSLFRGDAMAHMARST